MPPEQVIWLPLITLFGSCVGQRWLEIETPSGRTMRTLLNVCAGPVNRPAPATSLGLKRLHVKTAPTVRRLAALVHQPLHLAAELVQRPDD